MFGRIDWQCHHFDNLACYPPCAGHKVASSQMPAGRSLHIASRCSFIFSSHWTLPSRALEQQPLDITFTFCVPAFSLTCDSKRDRPATAPQTIAATRAALVYINPPSDKRTTSPLISSSTLQHYTFSRAACLYNVLSPIQ